MFHHQETPDYVAFCIMAAFVSVAAPSGLFWKTRKRLTPGVLELVFKLGKKEQEKKHSVSV